MAFWRYLAAAALWAVCVAISYGEWNGFKMIQEFAKKTPVEYLFQYIYYIFEVVLVFLVIVFGQRAGESGSEKRIFPGWYFVWNRFLLLGRKPVAAYAVILCMFIM